jgi:hypothetical protein
MTLMALEKIGVFLQPGALREEALVDLIDQIAGLDMDTVRREIKQANDDHNHADRRS